MAARKPRKPPQSLYHLTHYHQIWFIDHMHLRTLPGGRKVYSLIIVDGMSRVLLSDEICLSKDARDAVLILLRAFIRWGLPEEILSDNGGAFISILYRLFLARLQVKISYITPGHPWENGYAESVIGTFRAYMYPHIQRQKTDTGVQRVYTEKTDYYNHRVHWAFQNDKVEIQEFFDSLVITYQSGAVVSYACSHERSQVTSIPSTPVFHDHPGIEPSGQLEFFDFSRFQLHYVSHRPANRKHPRGDAEQFMIEDLC